MGVTGVILAGGSGERFGAKIPKQFVKLAGREIIEYTIDVFQENKNIDEIVVVTRPEFDEHIWSLAQKNSWTKLVRVVRSGVDRFGSTESAIQALKSRGGDQCVVFHDAVRPLLDHATIERCIRALDDYDAVDVVIPSADTLVAVSKGGVVTNIPDRASMRRGQTPQAFRLSAVEKAYELANRERRRDFTCDCGVVRAMLPEVAIKTVLGADTNIKITTQLDLFLAEKLLQSRSAEIEEDSLVSLEGKRLVIFGGSSGIGEAVAHLASDLGAIVRTASRSEGGVDVGHFDAVQNFLSSVSHSDGPIDAVINSAGLLIRRPISQMSEEEIESLIKVNYLGALNVARASRPFLEKTDGMLINFTSSSYTRGRANYAVYSSTKCAVVNLTQALAEEWTELGVKVNCINPQRTRTPMRIENFGLEDPATLLSPEVVARHTLAAIASGHTGMIVDVKTERAR